MQIGWCFQVNLPQHNCNVQKNNFKSLNTFMNKTPIFKTTKMKDASVVSDSIFLLSLLISLMQLGKAMQFSFPNRICWLLKSDIESANYWTSMLLCCLTMGVRVVVFNFTFNSISVISWRLCYVYVIFHICIR
jgi:hypothetical protein